MSRYVTVRVTVRGVSGAHVLDERENVQFFDDTWQKKLLNSSFIYMNVPTQPIAACVFLVQKKLRNNSLCAVYA